VDRLTVPIDIGSPVREVFSYVAEQRNYTSWRPGLSSCELTSGGLMEVGATKPMTRSEMGKTSDPSQGTKDDDVGARSPHGDHGRSKRRQRNLIQHLPVLKIGCLVRHLASHQCENRIEVRNISLRHL